ncbi:PHM/PNGase F domain-containing protein [Haematococcus lacustris]
MAYFVRTLLLLFIAQQASAQADVACWSSSVGFSRAEYPFCKRLSPEYCLHWRVDAGFVTFAIAVAGKYKMVGLGISNSGGMMGADIMILKKQESITAGSTWQIGDYFSTEEEAPVLDEQQDYNLLSITQNSLLTTAVVRRALDTCDMADIQVFNDTDQTIIWAYAEAFGYHGQTRGQLPLRLNPATYNTTLNVTGAGSNLGNLTEYTYRLGQTFQDPADLAQLPLSVHTYRVPAATTTYTCTGLPLPDDGTKKHIIRYEPVVTSPLVHHMILYACSKAPARLNTPLVCNEVPEDCSYPIAFYGPGSGPFNLPAEAGLPFGGPGGVSYVMLQIHYNNPTGLRNAVDSSGITVHYTQQLRPFDMGVLTLGSYDINVPPGQSNFSVPANACPSACTSRLTHSLTLTYNFLHMHQTGSAIITRHVRNGSAIQPLGYKNWYDFDAQGASQVLPESRTLMPGDTLVTTCTYNTEGRTNVTRFGLSSQDEMCYNFLNYYPAAAHASECIQDNDVPALATCAFNTAPHQQLAALTATLAAALAASLPPSSPLNTSTMAAQLAAAIPTDRLTYAMFLGVQALNITGSSAGQLPSQAAAQAAAEAAVRAALSQALAASPALNTTLGGSGLSLQALVAALNVSQVMDTLPLVTVGPGDVSFRPYTRPCLLLAPPPSPVYHTGPAAAAIVCTVLGLTVLGTFLWFQYARKEDPERLQLLDELRQTMMQEASANPDALTEEALRAKLEEVARQKIAAMTESSAPLTPDARSQGTAYWRV